MPEPLLMPSKLISFNGNLTKLTIFRRQMLQQYHGDYLLHFCALCEP